MKKTINIVAAAFIILLFFAQTGQATQPENLQNTILSYLGQPDFSGNDFWQKLSDTETKIETINIFEKNIYLSVSINDYSKKMLDLICTNLKHLEFGKTEKSKKFAFFSENQDRIILGNYQYYGANRYFFRIPIDSLKMDLSKKIKYQFGKITYNISIPELHAFISNKSVYGGYLSIIESIENNTITTFSNHGVFVAKKGETSLKKLVSCIIAGATSKESKAQKLLDFVTTKIEYDHTEALSVSETLKRPNEILMTQKSDCSGKAILYASLLEQTDIDYRLLYIGDSSVDHIAVAVEGNYIDLNSLGFRLGTKTYSVAETTITGFKIGRSVPIIASGIMRLLFIKYTQKPGKDSKIYDVRTGKSLSFAN